MFESVACLKKNFKQAIELAEKRLTRCPSLSYCPILQTDSVPRVHVSRTSSLEFKAFAVSLERLKGWAQNQWFFRSTPTEESMSCITQWTSLSARAHANPVTACW